MEKPHIIVYNGCSIHDRGDATMLFQKDIEPRCAYCKRGAQLGEDQVMCLKKGIVSAAGSCRGFRYDPLKRVPPKPVYADFSKLKDEDFAI
jgi:hypothetical protein